MKSKKILTKSILVVITALYFQVSQACNLTNEAEELLTISKSVKARGSDTESYKFKPDTCLQKQKESVKTELHANSYADQTHAPLNAHQAHLKMLKHNSGKWTS